MELLRDVQQYFPIEKFRFSQENIIRAILDGRDVCGIIPTGGGKSICYQYPAMKLPGITIVVSPLIALMNDQVAHLEELGIPAKCINKDVSSKDKKEIMLDGIAGKYKLLYVSPERLISPKFVRFAKELDVSLLVVDEAHCTSLWGYDFRPEYLKISRFFALTGKRPTVAAFTATATEFVKNDIVRLLGMDNPYIVNDGYIRTNLDVEVKSYKSVAGKSKGIISFVRRHVNQSGIVYCATVENVKKVHDSLVTKGYKAVRYYAELDDEIKTESFESFMNGEAKVMVCTNAFGMGMDKGDIRYVLHYDMAKNIESYYQEIGRAGRDGEKSKCILYYTDDDRKLAYGMMKAQMESSQLESPIKEIIFEITEKRLRAMIDYAAEGTGKGSDELLEIIQKYFLEDEAEKGLPENVGQIQDDFIKNIDNINVLYTNETKVSKIIRNGLYEPGRIENVEVAEYKGVKRYVTFLLSEKIDYFDMCVADAVYTMIAWGRTKIYPKNILALLAGTRDVSLRPSSGSDGEGDKRRIIEESLEKMRNATIRIDQTRGNIGFSFSGSNNRIIEGQFLPIEKEGKSGYRILAVPPLYRYAEHTNGQFFTIPSKLLSVKIGTRKMPNSIENLKLRHFIARRYILSMPRRVFRSKRPISPRILFFNDIKGRRGMYDILNLDIEDDKYLRKRKYKRLWEKISSILDYYEQTGKVFSYEKIIGENEFGRNEIIGVELEYIWRTEK